MHKVLATVSAMANSSKNHSILIVGVADTECDANRVKEIDKIDPVEINGKYVVGLKREANALGVSDEDYLSLWLTTVKNSNLSSPLKENILGAVEWVNYRDLGLIIFNIPKQDQISIFEEKVYIRKGDETVIATPQEIAMLVNR